MAGIARVAFEADTGQFNVDIDQAERRYLQATEGMSAGSIKVELAQRRLQRALANYKPTSDQVLRATLALKSAQAEAAREAARLRSGLQGLVHDVERVGIGAAAGARALRGIRSAAIFGGAGFLSGFGVGQFLRSARDAAIGQQVALSQLQAALRAAGVAQSAYTGRVKEGLDAAERLGFAQEDAARSFSLAVRATRDVEKAQRLQSIASDVARGRNMNLVTATQLLVRVQAGQVGSLRRLGIEVGKGITGTEALRRVQEQYAGAAVAYADSAAGAQTRFGIAVHKTEATIGTALIPTITNLNTRLATWLDNSRNQERIQRDVNEALHVGGAVVHVLGDGFRLIAPPIRFVNRALGGTEHTLKLLGATFATMKLSAWIGQMRGVRTATAGAGAAANATAAAETRAAAATEAAGAAAATAATEYNALAAAEGRAATAGGGLAGGRGGFGRFALASQYVLAGYGLYEGAKYLAGKVPFGHSDQGVPQGYTFDDIVRLRNKLDNGVALTERERRLYRILTGRAAPADAATAGDRLNPRANVRRRRRLSLQGQFNIAAYDLAQAGLTVGTGDDERALEDQERILRQMIGREKNLQKKTDLVNQLDGVLSQLQQIRDQRTQQIADAARKRDQRTQQIADAARKRAQQRRQAAQRLERSRFGQVTGRLERFGAQARLLGSRGQFNRERDELRAEERYLEEQIRNRELSVAHRRQLQRKLDQVQQQLDNIGRQQRQARARAAAAREQRQDLLIQRAEARAALTDRTDDDLRAYRAEERLINKRLAALGRLKRLTNQQIEQQTSLLQQKKQVDDQIKELGGRGSASTLHANLSEFLSDFQRIVGNYAPNGSPLPTGRAETHLFEAVHELRQIRGHLGTWSKRQQFPASGYAIASAAAVTG